MTNLSRPLAESYLIDDLVTPLNNDKTLADQLTQKLMTEIRGGAYPVHARLPTERAMCMQYGVSRTVVREVISRLKSSGLVDTRQGSGTVVLEPSSEDAFRLNHRDRDPARDVLRILELRCGIESEMAGLAAERRTGADMQRINHAIDAIDTAVQRGGDGVKEDWEFHLAIAQATGNPYFPELLGVLTRAMKASIRITRGNEARQVVLAEQVRQEHEALRNAIQSGNVHAAREAAIAHMSGTATRIRHVEPAYWYGEGREAARRLARGSLVSGVFEDK